VPVHHRRLGDITILNQAVRLSHKPAAIVAATPELGEHTDEILAEAGYSPAEIAGLRARNAV